MSNHPLLKSLVPNPSSELISTMRDTSTHPKNVLDWREAQASRMGFDDVMSSFIALSRMDLSTMQHYIDDGCPPDVAVRILIGTDFTGQEDPQWGVVMEESKDGD